MSSRCQSQVLLFVQCVEGMGLWDQIYKVSMQSGLMRYSSDPKMVFVWSILIWDCWSLMSKNTYFNLILKMISSLVDRLLWLDELGIINYVLGK